jgi:hypothetical protein
MSDIYFLGNVTCAAHLDRYIHFAASDLFAHTESYNSLHERATLIVSMFSVKLSESSKISIKMILSLHFLHLDLRCCFTLLTIYMVILEQWNELISSNSRASLFLFITI